MVMVNVYLREGYPHEFKRWPGSAAMRLASIINGSRQGIMESKKD